MYILLPFCASEPPTNPVDISQDMELPTGEEGEVIISGWHVNTHQVNASTSRNACYVFTLKTLLQVESKRLIKDLDGRVWLRTEDAGYMDEEGRLWLVGRVKWRVVDPKSGKIHWSTVVEQQVSHDTIVW